LASKWDDVSFSGESRVKIYELIKIVDYSKITKMKSYRFYGDLQKYATVWLPIYKDGKHIIKQNGKPLNVPFNITNFDPETGTFDKTRECPFLQASEKIVAHIKDDKEKRSYMLQTGHYAQAINRDLQENPDKKGRPSKTEKASGFKESLDSDSYTPVEVHQLNYTIGQNLEAIKEANYKKDKKTGEKIYYHCADDKYGVDVNLKFNPNEKGQGKYKVVKGERTPLTEEEAAYLRWDIQGAIKATTMSRKEAKVEAERILGEFMKSVKGSKKGDDDSPDDEDMPDDIEDLLTDKKKSSKNKKRSKKDSPEDSPVDSPDENSPLDSPVDSPEDSPEEKKSSKKSSSKDKRKSKKDSPEDSPADSPEEKKSSKNKKRSKKDSPEDSPADSPEEKKSSKKSSSKDKKKSKKDSPEDSPDEDDDDSLIDLDEDDEDEDD
jgi:hypothetical protein